jgi:hypothetical protein
LNRDTTRVSCGIRNKIEEDHLTLSSHFYSYYYPTK